RSVWVQAQIFHQEIEIVRVRVVQVPQVDHRSDLRAAISPDWSGRQRAAATLRGGRTLPEIDSEPEQVVLRSRGRIVNHRLFDDRILQEVFQIHCSEYDAT